MDVLWSAAVSALVACTVYIAIIQSRRNDLAKKTGCKPIRMYPRCLLLEYQREQRRAFQTGRVNKFAMELYIKCGRSTYNLNAFGERTIFTMDPQNHRTVATNLTDWIKEEQAMMRPLFGATIHNQNGPTWKYTREIVNLVFQQAELENLTRFETFVDRFMDLVPRDGSTVDLQPLLGRLFLEFSIDFIFAGSIDSLHTDSDRLKEFVTAFDRASADARKRSRLTGLRAMLHYWWGLWDRKWTADCKIVHDYVDSCIARHRRPTEASLPAQPNACVLLEGMSHQISDPIELRSQLLGIFSVARSTIAVVFGNIMFMLARNPHIWAELREHALALDLGTEGKITYEQLKSLGTFRNTVLETLRVQSPVTRTQAVAARDTVLPCGGGPDGRSPAFVPKGSKIVLDKYPSFQNQNIWGEDIDEFRPSRFEGKQLGWQFTPFGGGPRICPANEQVILQCMYLLVRLVHTFETIENRDPCLGYIEDVRSCFESRNGCQIALYTARGN